MTNTENETESAESELLMAQARKIAIELLSSFTNSPFSMHAVLRHYYADEEPSTELFTILQSLTMGVVRYLNTIDFILVRGGFPFRIKDLPSSELNALRLAVYEGRWLKTPLKTLIRHYFNNNPQLKRSLFNSINASLETLTKHLPDAERLGVEFSHPTFLVKALLDYLPPEEVQELLETNLTLRPYYVRPNLFKSSVEETKDLLQQQGIEAVPDSEINGIFKVSKGAEKVVQSTIFRSGKVLIQDKASVLTVIALDPQPGEIIWDACAAPGMKTQLIWEKMQFEGRLVASDIHPTRLKAAVQRAEFLGLDSVTWLHADASTAIIRNADKILIDAPCSSTGILRSRPSFKWRLNKKTLFSLMSIQHKILDGILSTYSDAHGTELVYATCSLLPHEGESQIDSILKTHDVELLDIPITGAPGYSGFECSSKVKRFFPSTHDTSGFFIARLRIP